MEENTTPLSRLDRIRNYQSQEFWAILAMRPLAICLCWLVAESRAITPNRLTAASFVLLVASAGLIAFGSYPEFVAAAILINVAQVFDNADGTLARYRGCGTAFGSFFDKMCDVFGSILTGAAIGWAAWRTTHDPIYLLLGLGFSAFLIARGYSKWIAHAQEIARTTSHRAPDALPVAAPRRSGGEWVRLLVKAISRIYWFDEVDLPFWIGLFLILDRVAALAWVLAVSQAVGLVLVTAHRARLMHKLDTAHD